MPRADCSSPPPRLAPVAGGRAGGRQLWPHAKGQSPDTARSAWARCSARRRPGTVPYRRDAPLHYGEGGPVDFAEARRLLGLAAAQGDAKAQRNLGVMHLEGQCGPVDFAEARRLYGLAAAQGHAKAQFELGLMHRNGKGGPVDAAKAKRLLGLAAAQGEADAQCSLGDMHYLGQGGQVDFAEARRLFGLAGQRRSLARSSGTSCS